MGDDGQEAWTITKEDVRSYLHSLYLAERPNFTVVGMSSAMSEAEKY
jgi:hypothetical protein